MIYSFKEFLYLEESKERLAKILYILTEDEERDIERDIEREKTKEREFSKNKEYDNIDKDIEKEFGTINKNEEDDADRWFKNLEKMVYSNRPIKGKDNIFKGYKSSNAAIVGKMYAFRYDPLHKDKLKFFDENPLVIPFELKETVNGHGFLGINLHFIPNNKRKQVIEYFINLNPEKVYDTERILFDYNLNVKNNEKYRALYKSIRHYLMDRIVGRLYVIPKEDFINVVDLYSPKYVNLSGYNNIITYVNDDEDDEKLVNFSNKSNKKINKIYGLNINKKPESKKITTLKGDNNE